MLTKSKNWWVPTHVLAASVLLVGAVGAQTSVSSTTDEGPPGRIRPTHTPAERAQILKNLQEGVTIPYWIKQVTAPINGLVYPMTMVGKASPFDKSPQDKPVEYLTMALKISVKTDTGTVVQDPMTPPCGEKVPAIDLMMQSPLFEPVPFVINGVDVTKSIGGKSQFGTAFQRANFWGEITRKKPLGNHWKVQLKPSSKKPIFEEMELPGTSRAYTCEGGTGTSVRVKMADLRPKLYDLLKKHAAPNQIIFVVPYNVVILTLDEKSIAYGFHDSVPIGKDVQTFAFASYFDTPSYTKNFQLNDIETMVHETIELLNDPFGDDSPPPMPGVNKTPSWRAGSTQKCQSNLEPGDPINYYNTPPYAVTGANGYVYHYRDAAFYQWFYRIPTTAAGGKYSMMGTLTSSQDTLCR